MKQTSKIMPMPKSNYMKALGGMQVNLSPYFYISIHLFIETT